MFKNVRLSVSLAIMLGVFVGLQLISQGFGYWAITHTHEDVDRLTTLAIVQNHALDATTEHLMDARINLARAATRMAKGGEEPVKIVAYAKERTATAEQDFAVFTDSARAHGSDDARIAALRQRFAEFDGALKELVTFLDAGNLQAYLDQPTQKAQDQFLKERQVYADFVAADAAASIKSIDRLYELFIVGGAAIFLVLVVLSVFTKMTLQRGLLNPLKQAQRLFDAIAKGRLDNEVDTMGTNEIGQLFAGLRGMQASIARIVLSVRQASTQIATGTSEIAAGNADLSQRTEVQASNLQQTSTSMAKLSDTVKLNAGNAHQAHEMSKSAAEAASLGGQVVDSVVATMDEIATSSKKVAEIIGVIDGIAFQTNILALNAAVEAARAGEGGRGFAVVAGEVRTLAQRSATAAREIRALIHQSVSEVESGNKLVGDAGNSMRDIVQRVRGVSDLISRISVATEQTSRSPSGAIPVVRALKFPGSLEFEA